MTISVPANERGVVRVFAINKPPQMVAQDLADHPVADIARRLLNAPHLDTSSAEIFAASDLVGVGLSSYLADGYAVTDDALTRDRAKLNALDGYVLLLFSDSFGGAETTLSPGKDVTMIGAYSEARADMSSRPIDADAARPYSGVPNLTPHPVPKGRPGSVLVAIAVITALALLLWWSL